MYKQLLQDDHLFSKEDLFTPTFDLISKIFCATMNMTGFGKDIYELYVQELAIADPHVKYRGKDYPIVKGG